MPKAPVAEEATANRINHSATIETRHLCVAPSYSRKTESVPVNYTPICAIRSSDFPVKDERLIPWDSSGGASTENMASSDFRNSSYKWGNRYATNSSFFKLRWFRNKLELLLEELIPRRILSTLIWWHPQLWCYKFVTDSGDATWSNFPLRKQRFVVSPHLQ